MASPYRFDAEPEREAGAGRSRTGLSAVTAGATSGGEGYRRSALLPGSRGYAAANFGAAPRTDYVPPVVPVATGPVAPVPAVGAPAVASPPASAGESARSDAAGDGAAGANGIEPAGEPGDLRNLIGDIDISGKTIGSVLGAGIGGLALGPLGALAGGIAGRAIGSSMGGGGGDGMASGAELGGLNAAAEQNASAMAGAGFGDARGLATGGRVGPQHLRKGMPMHGVKKGGLGAVTAGGKASMPGYQAGGPVDALAGPNPPGPDDGFAALDQGEFVVKQDQAQRPDYAPILDQMNAGTYQPGADGDEGMGDLDLDMGAQGNYPPSTAESATPDDMMQRLAMMPPEQSQALSGALADPMLMSALFALLGPSFMGVMSALQSQGQQAQGMGMGMGMGGGMQPPGMLAIAPDRAGMRPPGGGLGAINA